MIVEVKTMLNNCGHDCIGFDVTENNGEYVCSKEWLCSYGKRAILYELQYRFEQMEHEAYKSDYAGMKEHIVWNKALKILEEYL